MKIVNIKRPITPKAGRPELQFMPSACCLIKFHENMTSGFKVMEQTRKTVNTQRAITPKIGKTELQFMCSARHGV